jgi:hypothetical protein
MVRLVFHSYQPFNRRRRSLPNHFFRNLILDTTDPKQPGGIPLVGLATGFVVPAFTQEKEEANPFPFGAIQAKPDKLFYQCQLFPEMLFADVRSLFLAVLRSKSHIVAEW